MYSFINGVLVPSSQATIAINDLSIQRGYAVFDFFKVRNYQPCFLQYHLDRLFQSAAALRLTGTFKKGEIEQMAVELIEKNAFADAGIKITITGGYSEDGYSMATPNLIITQVPLSLPTKMAAGIKLVTHQYQRQLPHVKTIDYLQAIYLQPYIKEQQADDVLYHDKGIVTECPRANFFIVTKRNEVITPASNILEGITRKRILALTGFNVVEKDIDLTDLENAQEAFVSSTTKIVMPVLAINGKKINNGVAGTVTEKVFNAIV